MAAYGTMLAVGLFWSGVFLTLVPLYGERVLGLSVGSLGVAMGLAGYLASTASFGLALWVAGCAVAWTARSRAPKTPTAHRG